MTSTNTLLRETNPHPVWGTTSSSCEPLPGWEGLLDLSDSLNAALLWVPHHSTQTAPELQERRSRYYWETTWKGEDIWRAKRFQKYVYIMTRATNLAGQLFGSPPANQDTEILDAALSRLEQLAEEDNDSEPVSEVAKERATRALKDASGLSEFRLPLIGADEDGGLGLTWRSNDKTVRAVFPGTADKHPFLFWRNGSKYGLLENLSSTSLSTWLRWLNQNERGHNWYQLSSMYFNCISCATQKEVSRR